jgi:hypothetical protein
VNDLILLLIASYLRKLIDPSESDSATAVGVTNDLKRFSDFLGTFDHSNIKYK